MLGYRSIPFCFFCLDVEFAFPLVDGGALRGHAKQTTLEKLCRKNLMIQTFFILFKNAFLRFLSWLLTIDTVKEAANFLLFYFKGSID